MTAAAIDRANIFFMASRVNGKRPHMKAEEFRKIALGFAEAVESAHLGHPDFRVGGKIFATLGYSDSSYGVVMLTPEAQQKAMQSNPAAFSPASGAWGRRGNTRVLLEAIDAQELREVMTIAWRKTAPKRLVG
jgi:hypothetical protein